MKEPRAFLAAFILAQGVPAAAAVSLIESSGIVQVRHGPQGPWSVVDRLPQRLEAGDQVRTGLKASAALSFEGAGRVDLEADASLALEEASSSGSSMRLLLGRLRAAVSRLDGRRFEVRTPAAACYVRGTEFRVSVLSGGRTLVELYRGHLGIEDNRGNQVLLQPHESLAVDRRGMGVPQRIPTSGESRHLSAHEAVRRELGLDMAKEELFADAARELELAQYQQGNVLLDMYGQRVRIEEYVLRPSPDQFKLVSLSKGAGGLAYFYYQGTFNRPLPADLSVVLRYIGGGVDSQPDYFLTGFQTGRSNLTDSMLEIAQGGHLVDVNHDGDSSDEVQYFFDPASGRFLDVSGRAVFQPIFDCYGLYLNGRLKYGWTGSNLTSYSQATGSSNTDPVSGAALTSANAYLDTNGLLATRSVNVTYPDADRLHQKVYDSFSDGTFISWDNYLLDYQGNVAGSPGFLGDPSGMSFKQMLLDFNVEQVVGASEFGGRSIDLMVAPRIFLQEGLVPWRVP